MNSAAAGEILVWRRLTGQSTQDWLEKTLGNPGFAGRFFCLENQLKTEK